MPIITCSKSQWFLVILTIVFSVGVSHAHVSEQNNCGINSALSLARVLGFKSDTRTQLESKYAAASVSLLDVKQMCQQLGVKTIGVKASLEELLQTGKPCIIGLKSPEHFTLLLDGTETELRLLDGDRGGLEIVKRAEIATRFTGFALVPEMTVSSKAPQLHIPMFDQYMTFEGIGQKIGYRFPITNVGKEPLAVEITGTSCGCTAAVLQSGEGKKLMLAAGQRSEIVVSYHVETQSSILQTVILKTNDPRRREVTLSIRGQLPPQLALSPPSLYVQQTRGEESDKIFKVIGPKATAIAKVWSDLPYLRFSVGEKDEDGERVLWPVAVQGFAKAPVGVIEGKVFVRLKDGKQVYVQVRGEIEGIALPGASEAAGLPRAEDDHSSPMGSPLSTVELGKRAPDFTAIDNNGRIWKLSNLRDKKAVVLTFFPKCFTGGCANHLSSLRNLQADFNKYGVQILAVSTDAAEGAQGQRAFATQWKLAFPLIPDTQRTLSKLFGAVQNDDERSARMTFLIDKSGIVRWIDTNVNIQTHGADILAKMRELGMAQ